MAVVLLVFGESLAPPPPICITTVGSPGILVVSGAQVVVLLLSIYIGLSRTVVDFFDRGHR